jgi:hypothetical protein
LFIFGGSFSFDHKLGTRESTNQLLQLDLIDNQLTIIKSNIAIAARKSHTAVTYKHSMLVFGGSSDNGAI